MAALTPAQLADPRVRELIAAAFRTPRSLSPALESDLAAFGASPDFARALQRVGEVEQRGAALPFARGDQFGGSLAHRLGITLGALCGPFGWMTRADIAALGLERRSFFHGC